MIFPLAKADYEAARDRGLLDSLVRAGKLVPCSEVDSDQIDLGKGVADYVLEHPRLDYISYPYEWSFSLLRDAALFHLDLHLEILERGFTLSDASAYNVQFQGPAPIFIDHLSLRRYTPGEFWTGHRQFCEQFLIPLLLRAKFGVGHNAWYRGNLEGIPLTEFAKFLRLRHKLSWNMLTHVVLQSRFQQKAATSTEVGKKVKSRRLPLSGYRGLLRQLRNWIARLSPADTDRTTWADYATTNTYDSEEEARKKQFIAGFVRNAGIKSAVDLGCNTGEYAKVALESGAGFVVGYDFDQQALDKAHQRAKMESLNFLPLFLDASNPSPAQGWDQAERAGFDSRASADAVFALAFEHHLAIARNVPLGQVIRWITAIGKSGVIEFVPKSDPTVQQMLAIRPDIFPDYTLEAFTEHLAARCRIVKTEQVSRSGRTLFAYET